jgi:bifunctional ADP-heptose synthase (sugar kinase/adenylyltransferase)
VFSGMFSAPAEILAGFGARRVLVVGDLMLDRFLWGQVQRISPVAPVPIVRLERETRSAGGAANVARNLTGLSVEAQLVGATGADAGREQLLQELTKDGLSTDGVLIADDRCTTV